MATTGQISTTSARGGYAFLPWLDSDFRKQAQAEMRFAQFARVKKAFGLRKGKVMNFDKRGRVNDAGSSLGETTRVPKSYFPIDQGTLTIGEYGNAIMLTEFVEDIAQLSIKTAGVDELRDDAARVKDAAIEAEMDNCAIRAVGTATASTIFTTDGTATATAGSNLNKYHVRKIVDYLKVNNAPPARSGNYWSICTIQAYSGLYEEIESLTMYTTLDNAAKGEVGRYYNTRFVTETNAMDNTIGASSVTGEAYFFGKDGTVMEGMAKPLHLRFDEEDFGREQYIAWLETCGYRLIWRNGDTITQVRTVKWCSA